MSILQKYIDAFSAGRDLSGDVAEIFLDGLITETNETLLAEVFRAWDQKGISGDEIYEIASLMRGRCTRVSSKHETFVDIVGTGGSRSKTFNVSTAAAFVIAGAGLPVAKHGNKAATSSSGSADVLSALGVEPAVDPATSERCLNDIGLCFMFAPNFHRLSPTLAKVRRGLGFPTIFNCVGPLCNPANAPHQVIGVWREELVEKMAAALSRLGTKKSWIVHGHDGLDEISLSGPTLVGEIENGAVRTFHISPADFSVDAKQLNGINAETPAESAKLILAVLDGEMVESAAVGLVMINAAAALHVAGCADSLRNAVGLARASLSSGNARKKLDELSDAVR